MKKGIIGKVLFGISLFFTVLFVAMVIGFAARPYSTLMPYAAQGEIAGIKVDFEVTFDSKNMIVETKNAENGKSIIEYKVELDNKAKADLKDKNKKGNLNAFQMKQTNSTVVLKNKGNIILVSVMGVLAFLGLINSTVIGIFAFRKKQ